MGFKVEKPGLFTTVQDLGRHGFQKDGVPVSGPMDARSHRMANLMLGNHPLAPVLEMGYQGPALRFLQDQVIALTGAPFEVHIQGQQVPGGRPVWVRKGEVLVIGPVMTGNWGYLAVAGGIQVPQVLGSAATYVRAGLGGLQGKPLRIGDEVPVNPLVLDDFPYLVKQMKLKETVPFLPASWYPSTQLFRRLEDSPVIRVLPGPEYEEFTPGSKRALWEETFMVTPQSDRMGYRLKGPPLLMQEPKEMLSSAVTFGTVQVPPQGNPIVLMADRQTTGGYPRIGQVISADLGVLAQVRPGQLVRFQEVTLAQAHHAYFLEEQKLETLHRSVALQHLP